MSVEIPLKHKYRVGGKSTQKSTGSISGVSGKHRGEKDKERLKLAQQITRDNQMVLVLRGGKKRTWARTSSMPS